MWDDGEGWSWVLVPPDGQGEPHQKKKKKKKKSLLKEGGGEGASEEDQPPQKRKKEEEKKEEEKKDEKKDEKLALKLSRGKPAEETQPTKEAEEEPPLSQGSSLTATTLPWD